MTSSGSESLWVRCCGVARPDSVARVVVDVLLGSGIGTVSARGRLSASARRSAASRFSVYTSVSRSGPASADHHEVHRGEGEQDDRGPDVEPQPEDVLVLDVVDPQHLDPGRARRCRPSRRAPSPGRGRASSAGRPTARTRRRRGPRSTRRGTSAGRWRTARSRAAGSRGRS